MILLFIGFLMIKKVWILGLSVILFISTFCISNNIVAQDDTEESIVRIDDPTDDWVKWDPYHIIPREDEAYDSGEPVKGLTGSTDIVAA